MAPNHRRDFLKQTTATAAVGLMTASTGSARPADAPGPEAFLCVNCGTQYPPSIRPLEHCPICEDEREFVGFDGQKWATLDQIRFDRKNRIRPEEPHLYWINTEPNFGIGQRAFLIQTPKGNILWDCVALIDDATIDQIKALGGIAEIAISHPHYYTSMVDMTGSMVPSRLPPPSCTARGSSRPAGSRSSPALRLGISTRSGLEECSRRRPRWKRSDASVGRVRRRGPSTSKRTPL